MKTKYIDPFIRASYDVLSEILKIKSSDIVLENVRVGDEKIELDDMAVIIGLVGSLTGRIILYTKKETAVKIASVMNGEKLKELSELTKSTIAELANLIISKAITCLNDDGIKLYITPPAMITGESIMIMGDENLYTFIIPITLPYGNINLHISYKVENEKF